MAFTVVGLVACISDRGTVTGADASACSLQLPTTAFGSAVVVVRDFRFTPVQVRVAAGQRITWVNCEPAGTESHTSTADAGKWSSPNLTSGEIFTTDVVSAGTYTYHCEVHPGMTASVVAQ